MYSAIALGLFVSVADHGSVAVALPSIANEFRTDLPTVQWVMIAYALTISSLLLPMGRLSDIVGRKRLYVGGFTIFLVAAFLCIVANDIVSLIGARVLMGLGASMTQATSMAILLSSFPESERGKALGLQISALGSGAVGGPAIGGFVVDAFGWQGVFFLTVALSVVAVAAAQVVLNRKRTDGTTSGGRFDLVGAVTSTAVMIVFLLAMSNGAEMGWRSPPIVVGFAAVLGLLSFFIIWEMRSRSPMLDLMLFRHRVFAIGIASNAMSYMGISSVRFLMPFYLQAVLGYSPAQVGLVLVPSAFAWMITGPLRWKAFGQIRLDAVQCGRAAPLGSWTVHPLAGDGDVAVVADRRGYGDAERRDRDIQCTEQQLDIQRGGAQEVRGDIGIHQPRAEHGKHHGHRRRDHDRRHGHGLPGV